MNIPIITIIITSTISIVIILLFLVKPELPLQVRDVRDSNPVTFLLTDF